METAIYPPGCGRCKSILGAIVVSTSKQEQGVQVLTAKTQGLMSLACFLLPQSPRWLILHNQSQKAMHNMELLDFAREEIEEDIHSLPARPEKPVAALSWKGVVDIFRKPYRFRSILALFVLGMVQLCGIDGVLYVC